MHGKLLTHSKGRLIIDKIKDDHLTPDQRMAEHKASVEHRGPDPHTTRLHLRAKLGDERGLVRGMYDRTTKRRRRGK